MIAATRITAPATYVQPALRVRRDGPDGEEQRIARQERRHHQPGLSKDDEKQDAIDPRAMLAGQRVQVILQMQGGRGLA